MPARTLVHLSDLHLGLSEAHDASVARLVEAVGAQDIDHVVVTGDVTHRGRLSELDSFHQMFAPLTGRLTVVPGNHDRGTDDAAARLMDNVRVDVVAAPGLHLVRVDSTAPHNRARFRSHGKLCLHVLEQVEQALQRARPGMLRAVLLHHHPLPLPEETLGEWFATLMGWPFALELPLGAELLNRLAGRADLVLHGHRHVPTAIPLRRENLHPLWVYNAGCSPELKRYRVFTHDDGRLVGAPVWRHPEDAPPLSPSPSFGYPAGVARPGRAPPASAWRT